MNQETSPSQFQEIDRFMNEQGIDVKGDDYLNEILQECQAGLEGQPSSLRMLNTYATRKIDQDSHTLKLIIDAGGTNFRVVVMLFQGMVKEIIYYQRYPMPGSQREISQEDFFSQIVDFLVPVLSRQDFKNYHTRFTGFTSLQFCFSYPVKIEAGEGYVTGLTKEICIEGLIGKPLKKNLLHTLHHRGYTTIKDVVILNDTTATLLSGCHEKLIKGEIDHYDGFLGIVWGTGFNIAYEESHFFPKPYVINSEAGNYTRFPMTPMDQIIDTQSHKPGEGLAEKKISGYYFGLMVKHLLSLFLENTLSPKVFSPEFREIFLNPKVELKSEHISQLLAIESTVENPEFFFKLNGEDTSRIISWDDQKYLKLFIHRLSRRSAFFTASITLGLMLRSLGFKPGYGVETKNNIANKKFCIVLDGSMIRKMPGLKKQFTDILTTFTAPYSLEFETLEIDRAPIVGTAIALLDFS